VVERLQDQDGMSHTNAIQGFASTLSQTGMTTRDEILKTFLFDEKVLVQIKRAIFKLLNFTFDQSLATS
jgi:hypothetical protein